MEGVRCWERCVGHRQSFVLAELLRGERLPEQVAVVVGVWERQSGRCDWKIPAKHRRGAPAAEHGAPG